MFNFKFNFNFVPVASDFIETHMSTANGEYVKVYLYILNMAVKGQGAEPRIIARRLNLLESDVLNAIEYWQEIGLLSSAGKTITIGASISTCEEPNSDTSASESPIRTQQPVSSQAPAYQGSPQASAQAASNIQAPQSHQTPNPAHTKKTAAQVSSEMLSNPELAGITEMAQEFLRKTLTNDEISTLYWFNDRDSGLGFSPELIMILLEYCVNKGKFDMRYIEKTAIGWHKRGIKTMEDAEKYLSSEEASNKFCYELKNLFGIKDRNLSKTEENYIKQWHDECGMDAEMIALAYEYCIMATNKLSFQYMDSIIKNWHKLGISTIEGAQKDREAFRNKNKNGKKFNDKNTSVYHQGTTDYSDLEKRMNEKY